MIAYNKTTMFFLVKTPPLRGDRLAMTAAALTCKFDIFTHGEAV